MSGAINIRPGVGILGLFKHMNYKPWYAIGEFVDNALASYLANRDRLRAANPAYQFRVVIDIDGDGTEIRIWDNAAGISANDYERAFITAVPPTDASGLSQFGIGMKSAACWFADRWAVKSTAMGESVERRVSFDIPKIVEQQIETMEVHETPARPEQHYTELRLTHLHKPPQTKTLGKIREHLAGMYREFLRSGEMVLEWRGERLTYLTPPTLVANRWDQRGSTPVAWRKQLDFLLPTGERVHGFAAIRETGSTREAGFALFRNRRLIVGSADETYRPEYIFGGTNSYRYQRIGGELHLEGFDVTHTKDGFVWGDLEQTFVEHLRRALDAEPLPLLVQAEKFRVRTVEATVSKAAEQAIASTASAIGAAATVIERQQEPQPRPVPLPERHEPAPVIGQKTISLLVQDEQWTITIDATTDEGRTDWLQIAERQQAGDAYRMHIRVSLASPFMVRFAGATADGLEPLLRLAAGVAIAEQNALRAGVKGAGEVRRNLNELLDEALARA